MTIFKYFFCAISGIPKEISEKEIKAIDISKLNSPRNDNPNLLVKVRAAKKLNRPEKSWIPTIDDIYFIYQEDYEKNWPNIYNPPPSIRSGPWGNPLYTKEYNKNLNFYY